MSLLWSKAMKPYEEARDEAALENTPRDDYPEQIAARRAFIEGADWCKSYFDKLQSQYIADLKSGASLYNTSLSDDLIIAQNRIHEQAELIIELRKDSARLEGILTQTKSVFLDFGYGFEFDYKTQREAIDAAMRDGK